MRTSNGSTVWNDLEGKKCRLNSYKWFGSYALMIVRTCCVPYRCFSSRYIAYGLDSLLKYQEFCCREGDPFQGPRVTSCLMLGNELSKKKHMLPKQEAWLGRTPRQRAAGSESPGELLCHMVCSLRIYGGGISFQMVSGQPSWLTTCPSWWCTHCSAEMYSSKEDSERLVGHVVSPSDFSRILLRVPCSLPGPTVVK